MAAAFIVVHVDVDSVYISHCSHHSQYIFDVICFDSINISLVKDAPDRNKFSLFIKKIAWIIKESSFAHRMKIIFEISQIKTIFSHFSREFSPSSSTCEHSLYMDWNWRMIARCLYHGILWKIREKTSLETFGKPPTPIIRKWQFAHSQQSTAFANKSV